MKTTAIIFVSILLSGYACHSGTNDKDLETALHDQFTRQAGKKKNVNESIFLVHSDSRNLHLKFSHTNQPEGEVPADKSFHTASIGKTFTSVMVAILCEEGLLDYQDQVSLYLEEDLLEGLFVVDGVDYAAEVRIHHLLNHTSGVADFYADKPDEGHNLMEMMVLDPDRIWSVEEVMQWTKDHMHAHFPPGEGFHYSDTGYELLSLIIERITGKTFEKVLHEKILDPLEMKHSYLMFHSAPAEESPWPMCDLHYKGVNLAKAHSSSFNRAGGGVVTTAEDLLKFIKAIQEYEIISETTFEQMQQWAKFGPGIDYGYGLMRFRFIGAPEKYLIWGNSGSIGTYMYYNPALDTYFIGTFNRVNYQHQPIFFLYRIMKTMFKMNVNSRYGS